MAPFPYLAMLAIMAGLASSMVVQMSVFAYAGYMVDYLGVVDDKDKAGYYAGVLSAAFMIGRLCSSHFWGVAADRWGRRFVLVVGIVSTVVFSVLFGCSTTFTSAFISRFLLGLLNGVMVVSRTLVSEVCGKEHETVGMGVVSTSWTVGGILGPGLGGLLAEPVKHHPAIFSEFGLFGRYPYLLPNVVGAGLSLVALPLVLCSMKDPQLAASSTNSTAKAWHWCSSWNCCFGGRSGGGGDCNQRNCNGDANGNDYGVRTEYAHVVEAESAQAPEESDNREPSRNQHGGGYCDERNCNGGGNGNGYGARAEYAPVHESESLQTRDESDIRTPSRTQQEVLPTVMPPRDERSALRKHSAELPLEASSVKSKPLLAHRHIRVVLLMNAIHACIYSGFDEVYPLWALSSAAKGGLDWSTPQIGKVFFSCGLIVLAVETMVVPYVTPWLGVKTSQRTGSIIQIPIFILIPMLSSANSDGLPVYLCSVALLVTCYACSNAIFVGLALSTNNATGSSRRGELNGISVTIESLARAISPVFCSMLFALSIDKRNSYPFGRHLVFYLLASMRLAVACLAWNTDINRQ